ncbi:MAG: flagellar biosynthesis anti-sigma factor FlgM [Deltaproteobacteria bacterium]|nr:flagellar biosynthesis anti-sigma factor FlgM [Deltaproteobacteria bacterium]MBW2659591.1 flagellar biosynthesis anti-sigma factor FlgM [Deltaproteobacteria bacterium]
MSIDFYGIGGPGQIGNLKKTSNAQTDPVDKVAGRDKVQFSSVLQDVHKAQSEGEPGNIERTERIQQIKQQVAEGSYEPDLNKVSASLLQFLVEGK